MAQIIRSYIVTVVGLEGSDQELPVEIETSPDNTMLDDAPEAFREAQKKAAAKTVDFGSFDSDSVYLDTIDRRADEYQLVSIRKPGRHARFAYEGYVAENDEPTYSGPVLAVDADEADFAARWGIALQHGALHDEASIRNAEGFFAALEDTVVLSCQEHPVTLHELAASAQSVLAAHDARQPLSDQIDDLAVLTALVIPQTITDAGASMPSNHAPTETRAYAVHFEGHSAHVHTEVQSPVGHSMLDDFLPAVARAREIIAASEADAATRRIEGFGKAGNTVRYSVEGEYTNGEDPPTWSDCIHAVDREDAEFQTKLSIALNQGSRLEDLEDLLATMRGIEVLACEPEPVTKEELAQAVVQLISIHNAGGDLVSNIMTLSSMVRSCGYAIPEQLFPAAQQDAAA